MNCKYRKLTKKNLILIILSLGFIFTNAQENLQLKNYNPDKNGDPWYGSNLTDEGINESWNEVPLYKPSTNELKSISELPSIVNNSTLKFFRPIFNQSGGSCSQATGIGYVFTYEINWIRNTNAKYYSSNRYPSHFTWNFLNGGEGSGSYFPDAWRIAMDHGIPNIIDYGGGMASLGSTGWMTGYDKYYNALQNRCIVSWEKIPINTPSQVQILKGWLYNHNTIDEPHGGIASFYGKMDDIEIKKIPNGMYQSGKSVITKWGESGGHGMTIVGYDDSIKWDFNNDSKFTNNIDINGDGVVDLNDWEIGAWIIANSWGANWRDQGYAYVPYQALADPKKFAGIIKTKAEYIPKLVMKINIDYEKRDQIKFIVGINQDINASSPVRTKEFLKTFNYRGGKHPLLGEDKTGEMEIALDLTDLLSYVNTDQPVKVFFRVVAKNQASPAIGHINQMSVLSYISNTDGEEIISDDTQLPINHNSTTTAAVTVPKSMLQDPLSLKETNSLSENIKIFYSNNIMKIENLNFDSTSRINIFNINGQSIHSGIMKYGINEYDIQAKGIYIVTISNKSEVLSKKITAF